MSDHSSSMSGSGSEGQPAGKASGNGCKKIVIISSVAAVAVVAAVVGIFCCRKATHSCGGQELKTAGVAQTIRTNLENAKMNYTELTDDMMKHLRTTGDEEMKHAELKPESEVCIVDPKSTKDAHVKPHGPFKWDELLGELAKAEQHDEDKMTKINIAKHLLHIRDIRPASDGTFSDVSKTAFKALVETETDEKVKKQFEIAYEIVEGNHGRIDDFTGLEEDATPPKAKDSSGGNECVGGGRAIGYILPALVQKGCGGVVDLKTMTKATTTTDGKAHTKDIEDDTDVCFKQGNVFLGPIKASELMKHTTSTGSGSTGSGSTASGSTGSGSTGSGPH